MVTRWPTYPQRCRKFFDRLFPRCLRNCNRALLFRSIFLLALFFTLVLSRNSSAHQMQLSASDVEADRFATHLCRLRNCSIASLYQQQLHNSYPSRLVVQYVESKFNGFGAQLVRIVDAFALAIVLHARFEIATSKYWNYGCAPWHGWSCYFNDHAHNIRLSCIEFEHWSPKSITSCVHVTTDKSTAFAAAILRQSEAPLEDSRLLANCLWTLNEQTRIQIDRMKQTMNFPYIGLHVRRGDKKSEVPYVHPNKYVYAVNCIDPHRQLTVYIATDDGSVLPILRALLAPRRVISQPDTLNRRGHIQLHSNRNYLKRNRKIVTALLRDIEALRHANYFVGTFSSNLSRLIHLLRRNTSYSLDNRWTPGVAWRAFNSKACTMSCRCFI